MSPEGGADHAAELKENLITLRLVSGALIHRLAKAVVKDDPMARSTASRIMTWDHLIESLIAQLEGDGPINIEGKARLSETLWQIMAMIEGSTYGIADMDQRQAPKRQIARARDKLRANRLPDLERLDRAVMSVLLKRNVDPVDSAKFAESIVADVRAECESDGAWPSARTVRRAVRRATLKCATKL